MTDEDKTLNVSFIGTRKTDDKQQLAYQVNDQLLFVDVDSRTFLAGERIVKAAGKALAMHASAIKQGLIEAAS